MKKKIKQLSNNVNRYLRKKPDCRSKWVPVKIFVVPQELVYGSVWTPWCQGRHAVFLLSSLPVNTLTGTSLPTPWQPQAIPSCLVTFKRLFNKILSYTNTFNWGKFDFFSRFMRVSWVWINTFLVLTLHPSSELTRNRRSSGQFRHLPLRIPLSFCCSWSLQGVAGRL